MTKQTLTLHDLIELVEASVKSKSIQKDYADYLNICRDLGISSYTLNLIIQKSTKRKDFEIGIIDNSFWDIDKEGEKKNKEKILALKKTISSLKSELEFARLSSDVIIKDGKKWRYKLCIAILICLCFVITFIAHFYREDSISNARRANFAKKEITKLSHKIIDVPLDSMKLEDWTSINTTDNTHSECKYNFYAFRGDTLKYNYKVSSESGYDILTVNLSGETFKNYTLTNVSGVSQSVRTYIFKADGTYTFRATYRKDGSYSRNQDKAWVWGIEIQRDNYIKKLIEVKEYCDSINKNI